MTDLEMFKEYQKKYALQFKQRLLDPRERDEAREESRRRLVSAEIIDETGRLTALYRN